LAAHSEWIWLGLAAHTKWIWLGLTAHDKWIWLGLAGFAARGITEQWGSCWISLFCWGFSFEWVKTCGHCALFWILKTRKNGRVLSLQTANEALG
jgi:hypothetical protein